MLIGFVFVRRFFVGTGRFLATFGQAAAHHRQWTTHDDPPRARWSASAISSWGGSLSGGGMCVAKIGPLGGGDWRGPKTSKRSMEEALEQSSGASSRSTVNLAPSRRPSTARAARVGAGRPSPRVGESRHAVRRWPAGLRFGTRQGSRRWSWTPTTLPRTLNLSSSSSTIGRSPVLSPLHPPHLQRRQRRRHCARSLDLLAQHPALERRSILHALTAVIGLSTIARLCSARCSAPAAPASTK
ncbi:hypothetical protein AMAG_20601 [Allomyces macrogynus ATCC 38327]|uniref:Uncharacterized protein n=1 Tax=Allomyces macrogynus (strain ATCC 38327) TaxID=578462 RepID=A0A0L0TCI4_ALLM3|nr:hypothetical protein AMAG_20601 [Allomyces macrogynus ATCC 38327]|eukprot:KNE72543.1 hypothetical protein AMAG_20601 [Allomyces macrogynus ATCC 38327]